MPDRRITNPAYPGRVFVQNEDGSGTWVKEERKARKPNGHEPFLNGDTATGKDPEVIMNCASNIRPESVNWFWKGWLARGKLHLIAGAPEAGKTTIALSFMAAASSGGMMPDGTHAPQGSVLMWTSEDDLADTLVPRLMRMGADLTRIYFIAQTRDPSGKPRPFNPATDFPALAQKAKEIGSVVMIVIDPFVAVMPGNRDSHKAAETRNGLQPILDLTEAVDCVTIGIAHLTKSSSGKDPLERL